MQRKWWHIFLTLVVTILVVTGVAYWAFREAMLAETNARYSGLQSMVAAQLDKTIRGMEMSATNMFNEVEKHLDSPESVIEALMSESNLNPDVRGYFAAFAPNYFAEKGTWFEPYVHHTDSTKFEMTQVGSARHDYTKSSWFVQAKKTRTAFWSDPYYYYDGTGISGHYSTFVKPVYDAKGQLVCVCGADITFEWLANELERIDNWCRSIPYISRFKLKRDFDFYSVVLDKEGTCIVHPEDKNVPINDEHFLYNLSKRESGAVDMMVEGVPSTLYYGPIEGMDWTVIVVAPQDDIQKPFVFVGIVLAFIAVIGIIVVWLVCRRFKRSAMVLLLLMTAVATQGQDDVRLFRNYNAADGLADNSAQVISCTRTGRLVIATMGQINFYDGQRFVYIDPTDENVFPLDRYRGNYHLYFDRFHHIWLKNTYSVTCVDLITEKFVSSIENEFRNFGVEGTVHDLFVDDYNVVWLLTDDGLYNVDTKRTMKVRTDLNLQDLEVYRDNTLMLFFENGLLEMYDIPSGKKLHSSYAYREADKEKFMNSSVLNMDENVLYQIRNGEKEAILLQFDIPRKQWKEILRTPYHLNNMARNDSLMYVPSEYGYWVYNTLNQRLKHQEELLLEGGRKMNTDINVMCFDRQGGLWAGTEKRGLLYSLPFKAPFKSYTWDQKRAMELGAMMDAMDKPNTFRQKYVNCVYRDSRGWTWVGTSQGLQLYRKTNDVLPQVFTKKDGFLNNVIHSIVEDHNHSMWVATSYGITCVQVANDKVGYIMSYNRNDNVPNEMFVNGRAMCMPNGEIVMQSLDHVVTFNPERMSTFKRANSFDIYPKLIRMMINGNEISTGQEYEGKVILDRALSRTYEINLNYNQNSLSLVFSALNYFRPQQTCYRVRIKGLTDGWKVYTTYNSGGLVDSRGLLHLPLMALKPGTYTIELQSSMLPDQWDTTPYEWVIRIHEPWWRTTGVFALFGLLLLVLALVNGYLYVHNANLRAKRNAGEQNIIKRISKIAQRGLGKGELKLEPTAEELNGEDNTQQDELDPKFVSVMEKILPFVNDYYKIQGKNKKRLSMRLLSSEAKLDVQEFYRLISENIYKNPRPLFRKLMLDKAEILLRNKVRPIEQISEECGFISPNYFIAAFYRAYKMTPTQYRETL